MPLVIASSAPVARPAVSGVPFAGSSDVPLGTLVVTRDDRRDWREAPIEPSWILEGRPRARSIVLARGRDDFAVTTLWECSEGTFRWRFGWDETVHILDGRVDVTDDEGLVHVLEAGSIAVFPAGTWATWKVVGHVRKMAVCRRAFPAKVAMAIRFLGHARRMLGLV